MSIKNRILKSKFSWYTLVEIIIAIVIAWILITISFISYASYNSNARDSARVEDLTNIWKSLEFFSVKSWTYPDPGWTLTNITYSWAILWSQWSVWNNLIQTVWNISKKPVDPLNQNEYRYSLTKNQFEQNYELSSDIEWNDITAYISDKTYAASSWNYSLVKWNYNHFVVRAFTGWMYYAITSPVISITATSATWWNPNIMSLSWKLIFTNKPNTWISFTPQVAWSWTILILTSDEIQSFIDTIQSSFVWSDISWEQLYFDLLNQTWTREIDYWAKVFVNYLWWDI